MEVGAGTFHPATTLRALGPKPWNAAYVQPSRRPKDGRYGENPNRLQHYYQFQVIMKPSPPDFQDLYLESLARIGIDPLVHDIRFVEDDWESPTLGRLGARLGGVVRRHGGDAVHLFPAGRRLRLQPRVGRDHLRAGAARHVRAGRRPRVRSELQRPHGRAQAHLRRRVPAGRAGVLALQLRARRHRASCCSTSATRRRNARRCWRPARRRRRPTTSATSWRCRPTTRSSRPATSSTCWMPAA